MAVYTSLSDQEIADFIAPFGVGELVDYAGIAEGVENTNYFVTTDQSRLSEYRSAQQQQFVLTLFESIAPDELAFYSELTRYLNARNLPVPAPLSDRDGVVLHQLQDKPALLVPRYPGEHPEQPTMAQCQAIGRAMAELHQACLQAAFDHESIRSLHWLKQLAGELQQHPKLASDDQPLLQIARQLIEKVSTCSLPRAIIHGDLFRDNALFVGDRLSAIIDFNSAGNGYLLLDLAVLVNDWCSRSDGSLDEALSEALLAAYQQVRPLQTDEQALWQDFLCVAATRFWLSRLHSSFNPDHRLQDGLVPRKDPQTFRRILQYHLTQA